jgi:hypothetical protein
MVWKPAGSARIAGEPNSDDGRQRQRNRDAPRGGPGAAAENGGGVFQFAGHVVECVGHQHEHEGEGVAGDHEDDAGQRIDVEQMLVALGAGQEAKELVEESAVRRGQQFPGDGAEERRRDEGGGDERANELAARHVRARHQPSHRCGNQAADDGGAGRDDRGRQQRIEEVGIGEQRDEVLQRHVISLVGQAVDQKPRHREHDQDDHDGGEQPQHRLGPVDPGFRGIDVGCDRHLQILSPSFRDAPIGADPESTSPHIGVSRWIPGSPLRDAPE